MTCEHYQTMLIDYRYDELPDDESNEVADHLRNCGACARAYCALDADLKGFGEAMSARPRPQVRNQLADRIAARFPEPLTARLAKIFVFPVPAYQVALTVLIAVGVGAAALHLSQTQPSPPAESQILIENYDADTLLSVPDRVL